jgi:hypothetical protein
VCSGGTTVLPLVTTGGSKSQSGGPVGQPVCMLNTVQSQKVGPRGTTLSTRMHRPPGHSCSATCERMYQKESYLGAARRIEKSTEFDLEALGGRLMKTMSR